MKLCMAFVAEAKPTSHEAKHFQLRLMLLNYELHKAAL